MTPAGKPQGGRNGGLSTPLPGDHAGFERLMQEHREFLRRAIESGMDPRLRSVLEPEDVFQDVMIAAYRAIGSVDFPSAQAFRRWLEVLTRNRLVDLTRRHFGTRRRKHAKVSLDQSVAADETGAGRRIRDRVPAQDPSPSAIATHREALEALDRVLGGIAAHHRQIIRMVHIDRLSTREIAARTGKTQEAVRKILSRALDSCRQVLLQGDGRP